ncbi:MAG: NAD(+)/NADH kinase [bacterium]|nr:NAD(+)/NADH kinase [bacterium]
MKYHFYFPKNPLDRRADDVKGWIEFWKNDVLAQDPKDADVLVIAGGDGTLLDAIHELQKFGKPFFGIGRGTKNYLLNEIRNPNNIPRKLSDCVPIALSLIAVTFHTQAGDMKRLAFNDVYVKSRKYSGVARMTIRTEFDGVFEAEGDGIIVASPQGSTAYTNAAGGAILPLESSEGHNNWALTGIVLMSSSLRHVIREQRIHMDFQYPVVGIADNEEVDGVTSLDIEPSAEKAIILFLPNEAFRERRRK